MRLFDSGESRLWFPLTLAHSEDQCVRDFQRELDLSDTRLETSGCHEVSQQLAVAFSYHIADILDRDQLIDINHILNGWGNVVFRGRKIVEWFELHFRYDEPGRPYLLQMNREGDVYPWQSFAYAAMAGI